MTEKEEGILKVFAFVIPNISELDKERLLSFGEGMAFQVKRKQSKKKKITRTAVG